MTPKDVIQAKAVKLVSKHQHIVLEWATGTGKTLGALKMIEEIRQFSPMSRGLLVFKESTHKKNWLDDIKKHGLMDLLDNIELVMYASLHKVKQDYYDFIVLDECHAVTWKRLELLQNIFIPTTRLIMLSATIPSDKKYLLEMIDKKVKLRYAKITLAQAIHLNILPEPIIYVHKISLKSTGKEKYGKIQNQFNYFHRNNMFGPIKTTGLKRKKFLADTKTGLAQVILSRNKGKRMICFAMDVNQAKDLSRGEDIVYSKKTAGENQNTIESFNSGRIDNLYAVKMLREGINLTNIDCGLIIQLDKEELAFYQMLGRCLRSKNPVMHMIVVENTTDEDYFNNVMDETLLKYVVYV